ncbi:TonB-dependent receptor [Chitinophaga sp. GCM10012297]|uniref:TonB-dependent receptor n=1 Tax=Chitinophaga chungangae TaxID=2821488 RepID=A0ABS3YG96_9BACT|nr:TonB-dependent receptor [Chitinophaga chungangae]MBO9153696.1 TonB-dependent receptor [Chitinophaga chungangae]
MFENLFFKRAVAPLRAAMLTLLAVCLLSGNVSYSQKVSISRKNMPLAEVLKSIREQTGYNFIFSSDALEKALPVTLDVKNEELEAVLKKIFDTQPLTYSINDKIIIVKPRKAVTATPSPVVQPVQITGLVTDENGTPLVGVTVRVQGGKQGTTTNPQGAFILTAEPDAVLEFSFIGFETQQLALNGKTKVEVKLKEKAAGINEVVVVGYGTAKRKDLTGSITSINADKYNTQATTNLSEYFSGTVAGLASNQGTSAQGGGSLEIRGVNSLRDESGPLIVLDGVIYNGNLRDINPSDVATIDVLKDASAAAVYGSRAANGVIIVSTKKGATGLPVINFSATVGYAEAANDYKPLGPEGYLQFRKDLFDIVKPQHAYYYANPFSLPDSVSIDEWRAFSNNPNANDTMEWLGRLNLNATEIQNYLAGRTTNWYDEVMQKGLRENYDISVSGGAPKINYYFSTGYTRNKGIIRGDEVKIFRTRLNLDARVADFIRIGLNSQFSGTDNSAVPVNNDNLDDFSPYGSMYNADGTLKLNPQDDALFRNPFLDNRYKDQFNKTNALFATLYGEVTLPFGFSYRISFQNRLANTRDYQFWPANTVTGGISHTNGYGTREDANTYEWMVDNILRWNKTFGQHSFDVTFLANAEKLKRWNSRQTNENFQPNSNLSWHGLQFGGNPTLSNSDLVQTGDALMGRINYSYKDKYLLTASWRRDGFSAFGQMHPRAYFPAVALGWRVSDESFFKVKWVDQLKLRASWGINGNRAVAAYDALANLDRNVYSDGTVVLTGVTNASMANPNLKWEQTESWNAGVDLTAFNSKVNVTLDLYRSFTNDLLLNRSLPIITGYANMTTNLGQLSNKGLELNLGTQNIQNERLSWRSTFTLTVNRNKIEKLWGDYETRTINGKEVTREVPDYANGWFPGQSIDRIWAYDIAGIWQQSEINAAKKYGLAPGDFRARDINGDSAYRQFDDKVFLGYTTPRYQLGLRNDFTIFKNIDVMVFLRADLGQYGARGDFNRSGSNVYDRSNALDLPYWSKNNPSDLYPRLNVNTIAYEGGIVMYESASFLRLQDLSVSYNFPKTLLAPVKLSSLKVFASARNLLTITKWTGWDPESRNNAMPRIFSVGLNTTL